MENNKNEVRQRPGRGRAKAPFGWIGLTLAIGVVVGLAYGAFRLGSKTDHATPAVLASAVESVVIPVEGMSCSACVSRVRKTLKGMEGVSEVQVSLEKREAEIRYAPEKISPERLAKSIDELGYKTGTPRVKEKSQ